MKSGGCLTNLKTSNRFYPANAEPAPAAELRTRFSARRNPLAIDGQGVLQFIRLPVSLRPRF